MVPQLLAIMVLPLVSVLVRQDKEVSLLVIIQLLLKMGSRSVKIPTLAQMELRSVGMLQLGQTKL